MSNSIETSHRSVKEYFSVVVKGFLMGAADVVPGVSGGTVALITGIYNELLNSLKNLTPGSLLVWKRSGFRAFWSHINAGFLLSLFFGMALSIKTLATVITTALDDYPLMIWGLFSGLILASLILLIRKQSRWVLWDYVGFVVGALFVIGVKLTTPTALPGEPWIVFLGGFIAICAMILPGISGSFILLLFGLYPVILAAVENTNVALLASFLVGCVCGLLVFARALSWLLDRYYQRTLSVLMGFLAGSLYVTWPWKHVVATQINRHGDTVPLEQVNVTPAMFEVLTGLDSQTLWVGFSFVFGAFLVLMVEVIFNGAKKLE